MRKLNKKYFSYQNNIDNMRAKDYSREKDLGKSIYVTGFLKVNRRGETRLKPYTIADIARICNVSKATVSRVVNKKDEGVGQETRSQIQKVIEELNFRPSVIARSIATSHSHMVGLVIPDASNLFYPVIIKAVCDALEKRGYLMILSNTDSDPVREAHILETMVDMRVEGIIICSGISNTRFLTDFQQYNIPLVAIGRGYDMDCSRASISGNNFSGAQAATRYLIEGNNKDIIFIDGDPAYTVVEQKRKGFEMAMQEAGRIVTPDMMFTGEHSFAYGERTVNRLLDENRPVSAIFAGSDLIAVGVVKALVSRKVKVPEEVEVIGFDDIILAQMCEPQLTTMRKPHEAMAKRAVEMLLQVIEGTIGDIRHITIDPELVVRGTTRPR